jgi:hypothetical protein
MSFGMGLVFVPVIRTALIGVSPSDSGVASAMINTTQQVGGSIGTALLNTVATTATVSYIKVHGPASMALGAVHGYTQAFLASAAFLLLALGAVWTLVTAGRLSESDTDPDADLALAPSLA